MSKVATNVLQFSSMSTALYFSCLDSISKKCMDYKTRFRYNHTGVISDIICSLDCPDEKEDLKINRELPNVI